MCPESCPQCPMGRLTLCQSDLVPSFGPIPHDPATWAITGHPVWPFGLISHLLLCSLTHLLFSNICPGHSLYPFSSQNLWFPSYLLNTLLTYLVHCLLHLVQCEHPEAGDVCLFCLLLFPQYLEQCWYLVDARWIATEKTMTANTCGGLTMGQMLHLMNFMHYFILPSFYKWQNWGTEY